MAARNPRVSTVVDATLLSWLRQRARREGISLSLVVRDILLRVREEDEDQYWVAAGEARLTSFAHDEAIAHGDAWK